MSPPAARHEPRSFTVGVLDPLGLIEDVLVACGVAAMREPLPERIPALLAQRGTGLDRVCLAVTNSSDFYGRQRFNAAHALAHALCQDPAELTVEGRGRRPQLEEVRADTFAAHLLAPIDGRRCAITGSARLDGADGSQVLPHGPDALVVADLAVAYGTSTSMMLRQLVEAGLLTEQRRVELRAEDPDVLIGQAGHAGVWAQWREQYEGVIAPPTELLHNALTAYSYGMLGVTFIGVAMPLTVSIRS